MINNKIKILFVDHTPFIGGGQLSLARHLKYLDKKKFDPSLVISRSSRFGYIYSECRVPIYRIEFNTLKRLHPKVVTDLLKSIRQFNNLIDRLKPEIVLTNTPRTMIVASLARKRFKLITYIRDYYPRWLLSLTKRRVDKFLMVSQAVNSYHRMEEKSEVVYLGSDISPKLSKVDLKMVSQLKKKLSLSAGDYIIGFVGRLVDWKGVDVLVEAVSKIKNPQVKLLIFGSGKNQKGNMKDHLIKQIKRNRLENRIKLLGFIKDQAAIYKLLNIFVLSSIKEEPFATSMIEAAMAQLPIIATNIGGTKEFIRPARNGLLIPPGNSDQLAKALVRLINDQSFSQKIAKQAYLDSQKFKEENLAERLSIIYQSLI